MLARRSLGSSGEMDDMAQVEKNTDFERLMLIYFMWNAALSFAGSLLFPYFFSLGITIEMMLFFGLLGYLAPAIYLLFLRGYDSRTAMCMGAASVGLSYMALIAFGSGIGPVLLYLIGAFSFLFFWTPFNTLWFGLEGKKNAGYSTLYNSLSVLIGVLTPALAGFVAQIYGFQSIFLIAIPLFFIVAALALFFAPQEKMSFDLWESWDSIAGFRTMFFLEGVMQIAGATLVPIISIQYFPKPLEFGLFLSGVTIFSVLASFLFAKISDDSGNRREFIVAASIGVGLSLIFAAFARDVTAWFAGMALLGFFRTIFYPFPLAILLDNKRHVARSMYAREIILNFGRVAGALLAIVLYVYTQDLRIPLAAIGLCMFAYAAVFEFVKRKRISGSGVSASS